jgi:putative FmdB family regulatory protein
MLALSVCECQPAEEIKVPTYQYACTACDHRFEAVQSFSDASLTTCPACSGALRKVFSSVGIVFKGSGFYRTDSRSGAGSTVANGDPGAKNGSGKDGGGKDGSGKDGSGKDGGGSERGSKEAAAKSGSSSDSSSSSSTSSKDRGSSSSSSSSSSSAPAAAAS